MTTAVTPAAPVVRTAPPSGRDSGAAEGAGPFASALDGALSENRGPVGERGAGRSGNGKPDQQPADPVAAAATAATAVAELQASADAAGVGAVLWALVLGGASSAGPVGDAATAAAGSVPVDGVPVTAASAVVGGVPVAGEALVPVVTGEQAVSDGSEGGPAPGGPPASVPGLGAAAHAAKAAGEHPGAAVSALARAQGADAAAGGATRGPVPASAAVPASPAGVATPALPLPTAVPGTAAPAADAAALSGLTIVEEPPATPTTGAPADGAAGSPAGGAVPVAGAAGSMSAGAGGSDRDPASSGPPSADGVSEVATSGQPAAPATVAAPADADGATGTAAAQPVGTQVARQVAVLRGGADGAHTLTLVLTPETLGPVEVKVTLNQGNVDLHLRGAHEHGRAALLDALPDLRRDLEASGLTVSKAEVDREAGGSWLERHAAAQQNPGDRGGQSDRGDARSRPGQTTADSRNDRPAPTTQRSTSSGVDVLA